MSEIIEPKYLTINQIFECKYSIPYYQRPYKWEKHHIKELFSDIDALIDTDNDLFFGSIYLNQTHNDVLSGKLKTFEIIDGQQRISTISIILLVVYALFLTLKHNDELDAEVNDAVHKIKALLWKENEGRFHNEYRVLNSGQIDEDSFFKIFEWALNSPEYLIDNVKKELKSTRKTYKEFFFNNVKTIYKCLMFGKPKTPEGADKDRFDIAHILCFTNFLLNKVKLIVVDLDPSDSDDHQQMFNIFESINGKGKRLEEIDLIKSYIFRNLHTSDCERYLNVWGNLIRDTNDRLYDYLLMFIDARIKYYKYKLWHLSFQDFCETTLLKKYETEDLACALKRLLDDLEKYSHLYPYLVEDIEPLIDNAEFKFFIDVMKRLHYVYPATLLFNVFIDYDNGNNPNVSKQDVIDITRNSVLFMLLYQTLQNRSSRDTESKFKEFIKLSRQNPPYKDEILEKMNNELELCGMNEDGIYDRIINHNGYDSTPKRETKVLLSAYECYNPEVGKFIYEKMSSILKDKNVEVDHICPKKPDKDKNKYSYYHDVDGHKDIVRLRQGSDFRTDGVHNMMDYKLFCDITLNKLGNLQLMWKSENTTKSNGVYDFKQYRNFTTYARIKQRAKDIAKTLTNNGFFKLK